jgi:hypothetical protein
MAVKSAAGMSWKPESFDKGTSIGRGAIKTSSMNKSRRRSYKAYKGQGK